MFGRLNESPRIDVKMLYINGGVEKLTRPGQMSQNDASKKSPQGSDSETLLCVCRVCSIEMGHRDPFSENLRTTLINFWMEGFLPYENGAKSKKKYTFLPPSTGVSWFSWALRRDFIPHPILNYYIVTTLPC